MESVRPRAGFSCSRADAGSVRLAKGERESVQILVTPKSRDLKDVGVEVKMHDEQFASTNIASAVVGTLEGQTLQNQTPSFADAHHTQFAYAAVTDNDR